MDNKKQGLKVTLWISGVLTALICLIMNLFLIPSIEQAAGGLKCFDMRFGYSYNEALAFINDLTDGGKSIYLTRQLPLDFVYPVAYGVFFIRMIVFLLRKKNALCIVPALLMIADYTENIGVILMLKAMTPSTVLVTVASAATICKTILMYSCFLTLAVLIIRRVTEKKRKSSNV